MSKIYVITAGAYSNFHKEGQRQWKSLKIK